MNIVMLGPPGSGKGTQSARLASYFGAVLVDCGKLLRAARLDGSDQEQLRSGMLLSDDLVISIINKRISELVSTERNLILDGFPRSLRQCEALFKLATSLELNISCAIKLELSEGKSIERLLGRVICEKCGSLFDIMLMKCTECTSTSYKRREDDLDISSIKKRLSLYSAMEKDIVHLFKSNGIKILNSDADRLVNEVTDDLRKQLLMFI